MSPIGRDVREWLEERMNEDPELRAEYEALGPRFEAIQALIEARRKAGMTQSELAKRMRVSQAIVGRMESMEHSPRIDTLARAANAMGYELVVSMKKARRKAGAGKT